MRIVPEISGTTIVLVGSFNPAIFTPAWFELHELMPQGTSEIANLEVAHPQTTAFAAEWLHLNVTTERFSAETVQAPDIRVRDLVVRTFREHLNHTPLKAIGIRAQSRLGRTIAALTWRVLRLYVRRLAWAKETGETLQSPLRRAPA